MKDKNKKEKIWLFYLISDEEIHNTLKYDIYAFTNDIELADNFTNSRDMSKFYIKCKKINIEEKNNLIKYYMNCELEKMTCMTRMKNDYKIQSIALAVTRKERISCQNLSSLYLNEYIYREVWNDPQIFKSKYRNALNTILYEGLHKYISLGDNEIWENSISKMHSNDLSIMMQLIKESFIN